MKNLKGYHVVACVVTVCGTALGSIQLALYGDGAVISGMIGLYGIVLGYVFGRLQEKPEAE